MSLRYAYNTNGMAHHRLDDALSFLADTGYDGVALTLDHAHLDPFAPDLLGRASALARRLDGLGLGCVVETGARYVLDPRAKHEPTLVNPSADGRQQRVDFLQRAIDIAGACRAEAVSFWAGVPQPGITDTEAWKWLTEGVAEVLERARRAGVTVALEPEPGMVIETADGYLRLRQELGADDLALALDTGHCLVTGEREPPDAVRELAPHLGTVTVEDMKRGVHDHLAFGLGDFDLSGTLEALTEIEFDRLVCVELSRDAHRAHQIVPETLAALKAAEPRSSS